MPGRLLRDFRPRIERLEAKRPLSAGPSMAHASGAKGQAAMAGAAAASPAAFQHQPFLNLGIALDRVTNPHGRNADLDPPFGHVLVQSAEPVPGQVYNILFLNVFNGTGRVFTAKDGLRVRTSGTPTGQWFPILTGDQQWKPGGNIIFYIVNKKYYRLTPTQSAGFQFNFVSPRVTAIPGPSGIGLRVKYDPATFIKKLEWLVTSGPGAIGHQFGIPDTAIWNIIPSTPKVIHL